MTDHDRAAARREITNALMNALERRHEVLDLIVKADDRPSAVDGIVDLLSTSRLGAEAVIGMSFDQLTKDSRKKIAAEEAAGFVAVDSDEKVGMVFGELTGQEVHVRIWINPHYRHRGYGTAALAKSRPEMAAYFPAVPLVIHAPGATLV